jgi:tetratricopeptide (TPR) repeat protein
LLITISCLYRQYPVYQAYKQWKNNQIYYYAGVYKDISESYVPLYPHLNDQIRFLFEYAQCLSKSGQPEKSNAVLRRAMQISCDPMLYNVMGKNYQAMKQYEEAEAALVKAIQLVPSRLYPWYLLAKLYVEMGLDEKAAETAKIVLTKEPKVQSPAVKEMREEVRKLKAKN